MKGQIKKMDETITQAQTGKEFVQAESIKEEKLPKARIYTALAKAQGAFQKLYKNADNPFFKSKYLTLAEILDGTREALSANGIAIMQFPTVKYESSGAWVTVKTVLAHSSGEVIENDFLARAKSADVQSVGSATTYARRYALQSIIGIAADEDDDGNAAAGNTVPAHQSPQPQQAKQKEIKIDDSPFKPQTETQKTDNEINTDKEGAFIRCSKCFQPIKGKTTTGQTIAEYTLENFGAYYCKTCAKQAKQRN